MVVRVLYPFIGNDVVPSFVALEDRAGIARFFNREQEIFPRNPHQLRDIKERTGLHAK